MMRSTTKANLFDNIIAGAGAAIFWIGLWQLVYWYVGKEILVVSPFSAASRLVALSGQMFFWKSIGATCVRVLAGFFLALVAGTVLAVGAHRFRCVYLLLQPMFGVVKSTPVASFIILALIWLSSGRLPFFIAFIMVLPLIWTNLYKGIDAVDKDLLEMGRVFRFSRKRRARLIYIPALMPYFTAACSAGLGFAWKSAIAAEVICHPQNAIGTRIYDAKIYLETADLFAWTIGVVILSVFIEKLTLLLLGKVNRVLLGNRERGLYNVRDERHQ